MSFQTRVLNWTGRCFGPSLAYGPVERNDRFLEESLELVQSLGMSQERALAVLLWVYGTKEPGLPKQELGGVMITLAALAEARILGDMWDAAEHELQRLCETSNFEACAAKNLLKPRWPEVPE